MPNRNKPTRRVLPSAIALSLLLPAGFSPLVFAQDTNNAMLEEIVVTGARGRPRTVSDSPVPIDVFGADDLEAVSFTDTNDIIKTLVPSFNIGRQAISDGASFIRPAELRGMPTDKTLVLVNSKRRHRASLVQIGGAGSQGPDLATIPSIALKNVEVLRDGAAAQYGSDAIAGVINLILKDSNEGFSFSVDQGGFSEGDGDQTTIAGNIGFSLGENGFVNISAEFSEQDATVRGEQYCESWWCVDTDGDDAYRAGLASRNPNTGPGNVVQPWGQPNTEATRVFINAGLQLGENSELYGYANHSDSEGDGSFFYRYPGNGTIEDLREADGSIYSPLEKYPGGFTPRFFGEISDFSFVGGLKGETDGGLSYDFSGRHGENEISYTLSNTINPSQGPLSKESFRPGNLVNEETQFQADFSMELDSGFDNTVLAFGASYLDEAYEVVAGEPDSYTAGPYSVKDPHGLCNADMTASAAGASVIAAGSTLDCSDSSDPVYQVVGVGSNGFPGYSPQFSQRYERDSTALYADLSADVTDTLFLQGALRYEDYSDFDKELVYKLAGQLDLSDTISLRGSIGTGFRAPTPGQQGTINVSTRLPDGLPVATGLFPAGGPVAQALGASALKPELSENLSLGLVGSIGELDFTLDFYRIQLEDRFNAISTQDVSTDPTSGDAYANYLKLDAAGVAGANTIGGVFYFANAFDTETRGMDFVATYPLNWSAGTTLLTASVNFNETDFDSDPSAYLNIEDQFDFLNTDSRWRGVYSARHTAGDLTLIGRLNYYGEWENSNRNPFRVQTADSNIFTDIEAQYQVNENIRLSIGGRNIFDEYPDQDELSDFCCGRLYNSGTSVTWQGAYYFGRLNVNF